VQGTDGLFFHGLYLGLLSSKFKRLTAIFSSKKEKATLNEPPFQTVEGP
jgi:hypothetical protein